jgi:hypothetical protein
MPNAALIPRGAFSKGAEVTTVPPWYRAMRSILADVLLVMFIPLAALGSIDCTSCEYVNLPFHTAIGALSLVCAITAIRLISRD